MGATQDGPGPATMAPEALATRETLHRLVDELPDEALSQAARLLDDLVASSEPQARALIERWIRPHPHKSGPGEVVLAESGVPVYALVGQLPVINGDLDQVADAYEVPREAVDAALAYYRRHRAVIDARIYSGEPPANGVN